MTSRHDPEPRVDFQTQTANIIIQLPGILFPAIITNPHHFFRNIYLWRTLSRGLRSLAGDVINDNDVNDKFRRHRATICGKSCSSNRYMWPQFTRWWSIQVFNIIFVIVDYCGIRHPIRMVITIVLVCIGYFDQIYLDTGWADWQVYRLYLFWRDKCALFYI